MKNDQKNRMLRVFVFVLKRYIHINVVIYFANRKCIVLMFRREPEEKCDKDKCKKMWCNAHD